jgi:hypothetical protein
VQDDGGPRPRTKKDKLTCQRSRLRALHHANHSVKLRDSAFAALRDFVQATVGSFPVNCTLVDDLRSNFVSNLLNSVDVYFDKNESNFAGRLLRSAFIRMEQGVECSGLGECYDLALQSVYQLVVVQRPGLLGRYLSHLGELANKNSSSHPLKRIANDLLVLAQIDMDYVRHYINAGFELIADSEERRCVGKYAINVAEARVSCAIRRHELGWDQGGLSSSISRYVGDVEQLIAKYTEEGNAFGVEEAEVLDMRSSILHVQWQCDFYMSDFVETSEMLMEASQAQHQVSDRAAPKWRKRDRKRYFKCVLRLVDYYLGRGDFIKVREMLARTPLLFQLGTVPRHYFPFLSHMEARLSSFGMLEEADMFRAHVTGSAEVTALGLLVDSVENMSL